MNPPPVPSGGSDSQVCIITGKAAPVSEMIETPHGWVSAEGKEIYYQCLREGAPFPMRPGQTNARADGKRVVVPVQNPLLPLRCVKTNQPVTAENVKRKKLYWCPPLILLTILLNILILIILYLIFRKMVQIDIPLSPDGKKIVRRNSFIAWGALVAGVALLILPPSLGMTGNGALVSVLTGIALVLFGLIYAVLTSSILRVVKIQNGEAWLSGAGREFVASLQPYR